MKGEKEMNFNKIDQSVTMPEDTFRTIINTIRDESKWGEYITIYKNGDGTRTVKLNKKIKLNPKALLGYLGGMI